MHENDGPSFHSNYPGLHGMALFFFPFFFFFLSLTAFSFVLSLLCLLSLSRLLWPVRLKMDGLWETYIT